MHGERRRSRERERESREGFFLPDGGKECRQNRPDPKKDMALIPESAQDAKPCFFYTPAWNVCNGICGLVLVSVGVCTVPQVSIAPLFLAFAHSASSSRKKNRTKREDGTKLS